MSDRFDAELKKALKESANKSLQGWEFTPSMRQAVLKRIAEEEATPSAPIPLKRPGKISTRPYFWAAAAAAAFVVAINVMGKIDWNGNHIAQGEAPSAMKAAVQQDAAKRAPASQEAARESGSASGMVESMGAPPQGVAESAAAGTGSEPKAAMAATGQAEATGGQAEAAGGQVGATGGQAEAAGGQVGATGVQALAAADTVRTAPPVAAAPARIHLALPEKPNVVLMAQPKPEDSFGITAMVAPAEQLAMARIGSNVAVRTGTGLQFRDASGALVWEQPLPEGAGPLIVWNGQIVTTGGPELFIFDTEGRKVRTQTVGPADLVTLSADGRVAAISGSTLSVYEGGKLQFQVDGVAQTGLAFGPDGALAAVVQEADGIYLQLFGRDGTRLSRAKLKGWGLGIAFAARGDVILVGGEAFHRSGQPLWQTPFPAQEVFTLGPDGPVVVRDAGQTISLLRPADGAEIWTAQHAGLQTLFTAVSDNGDLLAVVAGLEEGAAVWVLDQAGGLRFAEQLALRPSGVAVQGETLYLLMPEGVETRALPPR